jgi:uncharacterized protein YdhG (YjbR/CyaY superfamily)
MATTDFKSVAKYIAAKPKDVQPILRRIRSTLSKALPRAEEVISYQIPAYKLNGTAVIFFAGWKEHCSLYPATAGVVETFKKELAPYEVSKGTIRFPLSKPMPFKLIERIAKLRATEVIEAAEAKLAVRKKRKR